MNIRSLARWPPRYIVASILCSFGNFLFGMDTGIIGSVVVMKTYTAEFGSLSPTVHGLIVSSILIPAAIASFFGGRVADSLGRTKSIAIGALIVGIGAALEAAATHLAMFIVGRIVEGVGEGLYLGTLVVYICEISPPSQRGPLTSGPQLMNTCGLMLGFFLCYGTARFESSIGWRTPFIVLAGLAFAFAAASSVWLVPSPRWLILRGRTAEAAAAWDVLEVGSADREKAEVEMAAADAVQEPPSVNSNTSRRDGTTVDGPPTPSKKHGIFDAFAADVRSRTLLGIFLLGMQQMSGIDGVLYYAPLLFTQAGLSSSQSSFLASGVSAIVIFAVTIPALLLADRWSRRTSTMLGGLLLALLMTLIGALYASGRVHPHRGPARWLVVAAIYAFAATFCVSWAVGIKIYVAESQPQRTRSAATNLAHGANWACNFLVALATPVLLARSAFAAYFLFAGCSLATVVVCAVYMPETKGKSLDEIEEAFRGRTVGSSRFTRGVRRVVGKVAAAVGM